MHNFENIPLEMKKAPQWVARVGKVPINPHNLRGASANKKNTWGTFEQAYNSIGKQAGSPESVKGKKCDGIGFELCPPFCGIDIDHCFNPSTGELTKEAADIINVIDSYTEFSPSGTGIHIICKIDKPLDLTRKKGKLDDVQALEIYENNRYFTVTGNVFGEPKPIKIQTSAVLRVHKAYLCDTNEPTNHAESVCKPLQPLNFTDEEIIRTALKSRNGAEFNALWNGDTSRYGGDESRADLALCNMLAFYCQGDKGAVDRLFRQSALMRPKWNEKRGVHTYGEMTIEKAVNSCREFYSPHRLSVTTDEPINEAEPRKTIVAPVWAYEDNGQWKIDEKVYITEFVKNHGVKCINGQLYSVDGEIPDGKAKQIIIKEILYYVKTNHGDKAEKLLKGIKSYCYIEPPKPSLDKIHFKNGTLSKDENGLFTVWSDKKEFCVNRIDSNYNPSAPSPKLFYNYLQEVYYPDDIKTLQQYCGYCLIPTTALQKALIVIGDGGEGKSVIGSILHGIFGNSNIYRAKIKKLNSEFGQCDLFGKLLMIDDDLSENALTDTSIFKELVTAKREITVNKKYVQGFTFTPYARFIIFGNFTLQALYDISNGFARRQLVLQAKPKNENRVDNPFLDEEIVKNEAEGVINWLVQGLNELIKNNFSLYVSERTNEVSEQLKRESDSVILFLDECSDVLIKPDLMIHSNDLYKCYEEFCEENVLVTLKSKTFVGALKSKGKRRGITYDTNINIRGKRKRGFKGIGYDVEIN